ncbi:MAG: serine hydrolase, partial [Chloroflexi bacterium]|nr:serine hydrolase [Chloroflexota bacterium]
MIIFGCSVLDINDMNGWWNNAESPGKEGINQVSGPQTWLGFQHYAPVVGDPDQEGETSLYALAAQRAGGDSWVDAWRKATGDETSITSHKFVGAVVIDGEACEYYYWKEYCYPIIGCTRYTWESVPCADWNSSNQQIQALLTASAEMHFYDAQGRHLGSDGQGGVDTEIPGSAYWTPIMAEEPGVSARRVSIRAADLSHGYRIELAGTGNGTFDLPLEVPDRSTGQLYQTTYLSVPVTIGDEFALALERGTDFVLAANRDGDEIFEDQVVPSSVSSRRVDTPVTLVLNGTAGANGWYLARFFGLPRKHWEPDELVSVIDNKPLKFEPGSRHEYSNSNYLLLGMILENVTGKPYETQIWESVDELGLDDTFFFTYPDNAVIANGYDETLLHLGTRNLTGFRRSLET